MPSYLSGPNSILAFNEGETTMTRVLIVDDHLAFAEGLDAVFRAKNGIESKGIATEAARARSLLLDHSEEIDAVTLDLELPDRHGLEIAEELRACHPELKILIVSAYSNPQYVLRALELEVDAFLLKSDGVGAICDAVERAAAGLKSYSPGIEEVAQALAPEAATPAGLRITTRQRSVLRLVAAGSSLGDAAKTLGIRERTARLHWYGALDRLGLRTLASAQVLR